MKENVKSIKVSERTKEFLTIKAELCIVYKHLCDALEKIDPRCEYEQSKKLKHTFLDTDAELMRYTTRIIEEELLMSDYNTL